MHDQVLLKFLGLPEPTRPLNSDKTQILINKRQAFSLELRKGFIFIARQRHIDIKTNDFSIGMALYDYQLKCFVLFDLQFFELAHQDIDQVEIYVCMVANLKRASDNSTSTDIILDISECTSLARCPVLHENEQLWQVEKKQIWGTNAL